MLFGKSCITRRELKSHAALGFQIPIVQNKPLDERAQEIELAS